MGHVRNVQAILVIAVVVAFACAGAAVSNVVITPNVIVTNSSRRNVTVRFYPVRPLTRLFLVKNRFANCSSPPSPGSRNIRTSILTVSSKRTVTFAAWRLDPGTYTVCFRNATSGGRRYSGYQPLRQSISIAQYTACRGGRYGVCKVTPGTAAAGAGNVTFTLLYVKPGTRAFLLNPKQFGVTLWNCTRPPPLNSGLRTKDAIVKVNGLVRFDLNGLAAGSYIICFRNTTRVTYQPLQQKVSISGEIDAGRSNITCCGGPFTVGQRTYCQINTRDTLGAPAGGPQDACSFRVCPLTDGRGEDIKNFVQPYFVTTGLFEFYFVATGSGCGATAGVAYKGQQLSGNQVNIFTLNPGTEYWRKNTATCAPSTAGQVTCNITRRDVYANPVGTCNVTGKGVKCT
jgi:hypothetical protein